MATEAETLAAAGVDSGLLDAVDDKTAAYLLYEWKHWARPNQLPPEGDWRGWLLMAGRGFGKTRTGAEWIRSNLEPDDRIALVGATTADVRDTMVEGESGILAISPPWDRPKYQPSRRRLTWENGAQATTFSADEPDRLRGPQFTRAWCDEIAAWRYPDAWRNLMGTLRLGRNPRWVATTTPRPVKLVRDLMDDERVVVTRGSSYENRRHLAAAFLEEIVSQYKGTRWERQEIMGELLEDVPGALWTRKQLDDLRLPEAPDLERIVVAIDPAVTSGEDSDETGIVVAGCSGDHGYVLADRSCRESPDTWAKRAVQLYHEYGGDRIIGEVNNGGDLIETILRTVDPNIPYRAVHASRGKRVRAEPIAALYEQGRIHHVGTFDALEDQMCLYTPDTKDSPDRVDALVWALTDLMLNRSGLRFRTL